MEISVNTPQPPPGLPPYQAAALSAQDLDGTLTDKEPVQEGEFAVLLASLQKPVAEQAAGETCTGAAEQLVPPGLQLLIQPAIAPDASGLVVPGPATQHAKEEVIKKVPLPGEVTPAGTEHDGLKGVFEQQLQSGVRGGAEHGAAKVTLASAHPSPGTLAIAPDAPGPVVPGPAVHHAKEEVIKTVPLPGEVTPAGTEHDGLIGVFEQQLQSGVRGGAEQGAARMAPAGTQPYPGRPAEGKPAGGPEQEKREVRQVESSTQPAGRTALTLAEPVPAEAIQRLRAVKSAVLEQVLEKMVFSRNESGEAKVLIRLNPPSLGQVEISLHLEDGRLTGRIVAENAMVRELLDASLSQLRQRLEAQQLQVAELTVTIGQEREFYRGRDRRDDSAPYPGGREKRNETAGAVPVIPPGLLNTLA